jgi:putative spermidine/putrescine transport system ATP-binding protein
MANDHFVRFENVDKSYDGKQLVVKGLDLDIAEGEFVTMLGPSGSGKTTCLMMLAGFETPTNGQIYLDNKVISDIPPHKRGIGMVFQNYALFPHMTVYENLAFPLRVRKIPKDEADKKVDKALSMVSLQGFEARMPMQLSGGQQQRVAVARSLVFDPQLVLMDEAFRSIGQKFKRKYAI